MKKLFLSSILIFAIAMAIAGEKQPDKVDFRISNRAASTPGTLNGPGTFHRPQIMPFDPNCSGAFSSLSFVGNNVFYEVHPIYSPTGENLVADIECFFDSYLILYCDPFDPAQPLNNLSCADDDDGGGLQSAFLPGDNIYLQPNTQYFIVVSSYSNGSSGNYTLNVGGGVLFGEVQVSRCTGNVTVAGEFNEWGLNGDPDLVLTQDQLNHAIWTGILELNPNSDQFGDPAVIEVKFRINSDWAVNWGATGFPSGIGVQDGPNIPVPINLNVPNEKYGITFNCETGEYTFVYLRFIPVSNWALYLGIFLIVTFAVIRFRRIV